MNRPVPSVSHYSPHVPAPLPSWQPHALSPDLPHLCRTEEPAWHAVTLHPCQVRCFLTLTVMPCKTWLPPGKPNSRGLREFTWIAHFSINSSFPCRHICRVYLLQVKHSQGFFSVPKAISRNFLLMSKIILPTSRAFTRNSSSSIPTPKPSSEVLWKTTTVNKFQGLKHLQLLFLEKTNTQ